MCFDDPRPEMGDGNREWAAEKGNITIMAQNDIGIDLGTTTIIIAQEGQGVVLNQPSVVAVDTRKNCVLEAGDKALAMVGRTPNYISAIFPLSVRGIGSSFGSAANWLGNFIVSQFFLVLLDAFGNNVGGPFAIFGVFSALSIPFVMRLVPETNGKSLEEIEEEMTKR